MGRFCYWYDSEGSWTQQPAHEQIVVERARFLAKLDSAATLLPNDSWIVGQRVRYLLETDSADAALSVTAECAADEWWCMALRGYVQHNLSDFAAAEASFAIALEKMPPWHACEWRDISLLLSGDLLEEYRKLECSERMGLERRVWWLADPLYMVPGNERETEHYSRMVANELLMVSASPRRMPWRDDNRELLIRYGPVIGWERARARSPSLATSELIGHHRKGSQHFIPPPVFVSDPSIILPGQWDIDPERPRSRYGPGYATEFVWLEHEITLFRRGNSAIAVAAFTSPQSTANDTMAPLNRLRLQCALVLTANETAPALIERSHNCAPVAGTVPLSQMLVSVEALVPSDSVAARGRYWLDLHQRLSTNSGEPTLSEILLTEPLEHPPQELESAIPHALPPSTIAPGGQIGLYWELYGAAGSPQLAVVSLTVEKVGKGFMRKAAEWIGLVGDRKDHIQMRWEDSIIPRAYSPRSITVQLSPQMEGTYLITVQVRLETGAEAVRTRRIDVGQ
ncbi:MAG: hypothetical protein AMS18_03650 [Gemmatimonas sp. SG8_17]|nr:MAG: hypothetical protein AMS18_03650 [Gemmatimonas sp. SG8_17]